MSVSEHVKCKIINIHNCQCFMSWNQNPTTEEQNSGSGFQTRLRNAGKCESHDTVSSNGDGNHTNGADVMQPDVGLRSSTSASEL